MTRRFDRLSKMKAEQLLELVMQEESDGGKYYTRLQLSLFVVMPCRSRGSVTLCNVPVLIFHHKISAKNLNLFCFQCANGFLGVYYLTQCFADRNSM